jgi:hypothetical protein
MSVGVGVGLIFLAREGLSLASLKRMEEEQESEEQALQLAAEEAEAEPAAQEEDPVRETERAGVRKAAG